MTIVDGCVSAGVGLVMECDGVPRHPGHCDVRGRNSPHDLTGAVSPGPGSLSNCLSHSSKENAELLETCQLSALSSVSHERMCLQQL